MRSRRALVVIAVVTAVLGIDAIATGSGRVAALGGLAAVIAATLSIGRTPSGVPPAPPATSSTPPAADVGVASGAGEAAAGLATKPPRIFDETTLTRALFSRVAMARRALRPLSLIHLELLVAGERNADADATFEQLLESTLRESDVCGRRADGVYVFILEDTGEDGAVWTAERLRRSLATSSSAEGIRFCAGIATYPNHGLEAATVDARAAVALDAARQWHRDRIEVADGP